MRCVLVQYNNKRADSIHSHERQNSHPGSGSDQTIASVRQVTALAMLYIGRLDTCGIDYSFTP